MGALVAACGWGAREHGMGVKNTMGTRAATRAPTTRPPHSRPYATLDGVPKNLPLRVPAPTGRHIYDVFAAAAAGSRMAK